MTIMLLGVLLATPVAPQLQAPQTVSSQDLRIAQGARAILGAPSKWNHADTGSCPADATTFSIYCALEKASKDLTGTFADGGPAPREGRQIVDFMAAKKYGARDELCGHPGVFSHSGESLDPAARAVVADGESAAGEVELPIPALQGPMGRLVRPDVRHGPLLLDCARAAIATGVWRREAQPTAVWSGSITNVPVRCARRDGDLIRRQGRAPNGMGMVSGVRLRVRRLRAAIHG
jgi:hypothetical protein